MYRTIKFLGIICMLTMIVAGAIAQPYIPGKVYYDSSKWVEFIPGTMPLVISVPHGGSVEPVGVPDRSCPGVVNTTDGRTISLARAIISAFKKNYGVYPSVIICQLKRTKVDMNREIEVATCSNDTMKVPWRFWHEMVDTAIASAINEFGQTLYIDLHGQGHPKQRLELGYLLSATQLQTSSTGNNDSLYTNTSSLKNLIKGSVAKLTLKKLLTGPDAFGTWMAEDSFPSVPSQQDPYPLSTDPYFDGGYNVQLFTSKPHVIGWQIESNNIGVRDNSTSWNAFAQAFSKNIVRYINTYMNIDLTQPLPVTIAAFTVKKENTHVKLQWHTSTELNTHHFIVQHSTDGSSFTNMATVKAIGSGANDYMFIDNTPVNGNNYYRLFIVDKNGTITYSKIISALLTTHNSQLTTFPNPATNFVTLKGSHIASVQIIDNLGRVVKTISMKDATNPTFSVHGLASGAYHLKVHTNDGKVSGGNLVVSY